MAKAVKTAVKIFAITFTLGMAFATLKLGRKLQVVFFSLAVLFFLLAAGDFLQNLMITKVAGAIGIFCGLSAIYAGFTAVFFAVNKGVKTK